MFSIPPSLCGGAGLSSQRRLLLLIGCRSLCFHGSHWRPTGEEEERRGEEHKKYYEGFYSFLPTCSHSNSHIWIFVLLSDSLLHYRVDAAIRHRVCSSTCFIKCTLCDTVNSPKSLLYMKLESDGGVRLLWHFSSPCWTSERCGRTVSCPLYRLWETLMTFTSWNSFARSARGNYSTQPRNNFNIQLHPQIDISFAWR